MSPGYGAYSINGKPWHVPRGNRAVQNVGLIDPALAHELFMRTHGTDIDINHKKKTTLALTMHDAIIACVANWTHFSTVDVPSQKSSLVAYKTANASDNRNIDKKANGNQWESWQTEMEEAGTNWQLL